MANLVVVWWRDIPAQVIAREGRRSAKRELGKRFIEAIDRTAMREGLAGSDVYLEHWRRAEPVPCSEDLEAEAERAAAELEAEFDALVLKSLAETGGWRR